MKDLTDKINDAKARYEFAVKKWGAVHSLTIWARHDVLRAQQKRKILESF